MSRIMAHRSPTGAVRPAFLIIGAGSPALIMTLIGG